MNDLFRRLRKLHNLSPERRSFLVWERVSAIIWGALRPWESSTSGGGNVDGSKGVLVGDVERSGRVAGGVWFESREPCPMMVWKEGMREVLVWRSGFLRLKSWDLLEAGGKLE